MKQTHSEKIGEFSGKCNHPHGLPTNVCFVVLVYNMSYMALSRYIVQNRAQDVRMFINKWPMIAVLTTLAIWEKTC